MSEPTTEAGAELENLTWSPDAVDANVAALDKYNESLFGKWDITANYEAAVDTLGRTTKLKGGNFDGGFDLTDRAGRRAHEALKALGRSLTPFFAASFQSSGGDLEAYRTEVSALADKVMVDIKGDDAHRAALGLDDAGIEARFNALNGQAV